jgi:histidinol dehydrogenase
MQIINNPNKNDWNTVLKRPTQTVGDIETKVIDIFNEVRLNGDEAIAKYTQQFDGISLDSHVVTTQEIEKAVASVSEELKNAIKTAKQNIEVFHTAQKTSRIEVETSKGVKCWQ